MQERKAAFGNIATVPSPSKDTPGAPRPASFVCGTQPSASVSAAAAFRLLLLPFVRV